MPTTKKRRIFVQCGCKRVTDQMQEVGIKHGRYFQAGKEIMGWVCTRKEYISDKSCLEKFNEDKAKYATHYHEPVR